MMQRRELFSSLASMARGKKEVQESKIIRPPYYIDENAFSKECIYCNGDCATICQEQVIKIADDKTPFLDLSQNGCIFCDECAIACKRGVLKVEYKNKIYAKITINMLLCLSWQRTMCFSCKDICLYNAIDFIGLFRPQIIEEKCTSCGLCIGICPTNAINIS